MREDKPDRTQEAPSGNRHRRVRRALSQRAGGGIQAVLDLLTVIEPSVIIISLVGH